MSPLSVELPDNIVRERGITLRCTKCKRAVTVLENHPKRIRATERRFIQHHEKCVKPKRKPPRRRPKPVPDDQLRLDV